MFGPILFWEMRVLTRRVRYYATRVLFCLIMFAILLSCFQTVGYRTTNSSEISQLNKSAQSFFNQFFFVQLVAVLVLTPAFFATCITTERERKTIDYLFASPLTNSELILGKWSARFLNLFMLMLAAIPLAYFARIFGRIDVYQLLASALVCSVTMVSISGYTMLVSAYSKIVRKALYRSYFHLIMILVAPLLAYTVVWFLTKFEVLPKAFLDTDYIAESKRHPIKDVQQWLYCLHPIFAYQMLVNMPFPLPKIQQNIAIYSACHFGIGFFSLLWATLYVRRIHLNDSSGIERKNQAWYRRNLLPKPKPFSNPVFWKEWYFANAGLSGRGIIRILLGMLLVAIIYGPFLLGPMVVNKAGGVFSMETLNSIYLGVNLIVMSIAYLQILVQAGSSIGNERDRDTLVSLLSTPLNATQILIGKILGSIKPAVIAVALFVPVWCWLIMFGAMSITAALMVAFLNLLFAVLLATIGVRQSLVWENSTAAIVMSFFVSSLFFGLGHLILLLIVLLEGDTLVSNRERLTEFFVLSIPWFSIGYGHHLGMSRSVEPMGLDAFAIAIVYFIVAIAVIILLTRSAFSDKLGRIDEQSSRTPNELPSEPPGKLATSPANTAHQESPASS